MSEYSSVIGEHRVLEKGPGLLAPSSLLYIRVFVCSFRSFVFVLFSGRGAPNFRQADRRELQCSPLSSAVGVLKASEVKICQGILKLII